MLEGDDREAGRRLFSNLAALEDIAVLACLKGHGVAGQLEDELRHRALFIARAEELGGVEPMPDSIANLTDFLKNLSGPESIAALNLVGEAWLENVFRFIGPAGPWAEMFAEIAEDEARHTALAAPELEPEAARPLVRCIEELLYAITIDPHFAWPMAWFTGLHALGKMGASAVDAHTAACQRLGLEPGIYATAIAGCGRVVDEMLDPRPETLSTGQANLIAASPFFGPSMGLSFEARWKHPRSASLVEARVARAVGSALARLPKLNRTLTPQRGEIFAPREAVVGVRRQHVDPRDIFTVYLRNPQLKADDQIEMELWRKTREGRLVKYHPVPALDPALWRLQPAPRCAATVTNVTPWTPLAGVGTAPLIPGEGTTLSVCITSLYRRWGRWYLTLTITADHRAHNGEELARMGELVRQYIEGK